MKFLTGLGLWLLIACAVPQLTASGSGEGRDWAATLAGQIDGKAFSLVDAIRAAEAETAGKALAAEVEVEDGRAVVEVLVLTKEPTGARLLEVEVDGASNRVLEVEEEDEDDDVEDDDDDDDDDSEEDDD